MSCGVSLPRDRHFCTQTRRGDESFVVASNVMLDAVATSWLSLITLEQQMVSVLPLFLGSIQLHG